jgi:hypothetical protein
MREYDIKLGNKSAHIYCEGYEVAQAIEISSGVYYSMIDNNGKAFGYDYERTTLAEWANRFTKQESVS